METDSVVYLRRVVCPSCGLHYAAYAQVSPGGKGVAVCPKCSTTVTQPLPPHYIAQVAPEDYVSPTHPSVRLTHYPGLYTQPKHPPRFDFSDLVRIMFSPVQAFTSLYLSTNLRRAMAIVLVFSLLSITISTLVTSRMSVVLGYDASDALNLAFQASAAFLLMIFTFLLLGLVTAWIAKVIFGGRGETSMTVTLLGYCYPLYVVLSIIILALFSVGFEGIDLTNMDAWTDAQMNQAIVWGAALLFVGFFGLGWLLWIVGRAVSVANDISTGEGVLSTILGGAIVGTLYLVAGAVTNLPLGLSL